MQSEELKERLSQILGMPVDVLGTEYRKGSVIVDAQIGVSKKALLASLLLNISVNLASNYAYDFLLSSSEAQAHVQHTCETIEEVVKTTYQYTDPESGVSMSITTTRRSYKEICEDVTSN